MMKEIQTSPGEHIGQACDRLAKSAPAFMVFNDVRVEAGPGETPDVLFARWDAEMTRKRVEYEASDLYRQREAESERRAIEERRTQEESRALVTASGVREKYPWPATMGEISGFGGGYENACREMVYAGLAWLQDRPTADLSSHETTDAKALDAVLLAAEPGCSGAMHGATMNAVAFIHRNGWGKYVARMTERATELPSVGGSK